MPSLHMCKQSEKINHYENYYTVFNRSGYLIYYINMLILFSFMLSWLIFLSFILNALIPYFDYMYNFNNFECL